MECKLESRALSQTDADVLVVGFFQDEDIAEALKKLDSSFDAEFANVIAQECARENFSGKSGQILVLPTFGRISAKRLVLRGLGKQQETNATTIRKAAGSISRKLNGTTDCSTVTLQLRIEDKPNYAQAAVEGWILGAYSFNKYKTVKADDKKTNSKTKALVLLTAVNNEQLQAACKRGQAIAQSTNLARDLVAEPPAVMTPARLADSAQTLASKGIKVEILEERDAEKLGMGSFLGVARGAKEPAKFIIMRYTAGGAKRTVGLAGKGITFDSGGLSLKTATGMENMKYDMSGAAAVIAAMNFVAEMKPNVNVIAVAAATENMPGGAALHPGDILTAKNGKTIEVNNTDAEGRLILADALCYLSEQKPDEILDLATLTGAAVTALGRVAAAIMGNDESLIQRVIQIGSEAGEKYWQLPMYDEYKDALKSDIADLKNAGAKGEAGTSAAAMFLKEFIDGCPWAHLDIAGPAWLDKDRDEMNKGGTAFGVRTLCYYLMNRSEN